MHYYKWECAKRAIICFYLITNFNSAISFDKFSKSGNKDDLFNPSIFIISKTPFLCSFSTLNLNMLLFRKGGSLNESVFP